MSKPNYTPGEWKTRDHHTFAQVDIYADTEECPRIAEVSLENFYDASDPDQCRQYHSTLQSNATLISAAPNMRDALESLVENIISGEGCCDFIKKENLDKAIAALKKANGEKC